jgi:cation-transporting P-type ATPase I
VSISSNTVHIEVRAGRRAAGAAMAHELQDALQAVKGVHWAEVNGVLGRVIVSFEEGEVDPDELVGIVASVEEASGVHEERFGHDRAEHPADHIGSRRALTALVADVGGLGVSLAGTALRLSPIPVEAASIFSLVDGVPRARHLLEERLGPSVTDVGLSVANAVAQSLGGGPFALAVDMVQRAQALGEARAAERCYEQKAAELHEPGAIHEIVVRERRPVALPAGPVERYADGVSLASILGAGAVFAATLDPRRSAAMVIAAVPKAAKLGRESYTSTIGRSLARRSIVVLDPGALRRLDRINTLVIDSELLASGRTEVRQVLLAPGADHILVHRIIAMIFDGTDPRSVRRRGAWAIGPVAEIASTRSAAVAELELQLGDSERLGVARGGEILAVFSLADELADGARQLGASASQAGVALVLAGSPPADLAERLGIDTIAPPGLALLDTVRDLQRNGDGVALLAGGPVAADALAAADFGLGALFDDERVPWAGDLLCPNSLADADYLLNVMGVAHQVSRQSAAIALAGTSVAAVIALLSPGASAGKRASNTVNAAALIALANGTRAGMAVSRRPTLPPPAPRWHELPLEEIFAALESSPQGLTQNEARHRHHRAPRPLPAPLRLGRSILSELANPLTPVLAAGSGLSAAVGSTVDAAIVAGVAGLGSVIGGVQRFTAERAVEALERRTSAQARVLHSDTPEPLVIDSGSLVVGDVVALQAGEAVPADCRIVEAEDLEVDESSMTGESVPVPKDSRPVFAPVLADRTSMLYEGTTIAAGSATGVVVAIGDSTEAGSALLAAPPPPSGGVEARLRDLTAMTIPFAAAGGAAVVGAGLLRGMPVASTVAPAVSLAVAAIPEGLPMLATAAQLAAARRLSSRDTVVRNPRALEALGRVDVLCADKTGTLTEGRIDLQAVVVGGDRQPIASLPITHRRVLAAGLRASPEQNGRPLPHMTDEAVLRGGAAAGVVEDEGALGWERLDELPFEPSRGYHASIGRVADGSHLLAVKGTPEELIMRCTRRLDTAGRRADLDTAGRDAITTEVDEIARSGFRVLAVAERRDRSGPGADTAGSRRSPQSAQGASAPPELDDGQIGDLDFLGLLAFADPVRPTAAEAVRGLQAAGVRVVMVTGDHPSTAEGIAAELGILAAGRVMTGAELDRSSDAVLDELLPEISVFARVAPADKVRIVAAYQRTGRVVAMTGDGANDAPAIRLADAGLAIGKRCTTSARDAADVVIADDRIETIVDAIIEGRVLWVSVRDAIGILVGGNIGEVIFTVAASVVTGRPPLTARQLLLVNLLTDIAPALTIATRPPPHLSVADLAAEGPERSLGGALRQEIMIRAITTAAGAGGAYTIASLTGRPRRASTTALAALVGTQLGQTLAASHRNPATIAAALGSAAVLAGIIQTPVVSQLFGCTPLGPVAWATATGSAAVATAGGVFVGSRLNPPRRSG